MIPKNDWLPFAKSLPVNSKRKSNHTCGNDKSMLVHHSEDSYSAYCFRCREHGYVSKELTHADRRKLRNQVLEEAVASRKDVLDVSRYIGLQECKVQHSATQEAIAYISARGVPPAWYKHLYCNVDLHTLYIPARYDNEFNVITLLARNLNATTNRDRFYQHGDTNALAITPLLMGNDLSPCPGGDTVVITEDILSTWHVAQVLPAGALIGTTLTDKHVYRLYEYAHVIIWLDGDKFGVQGAKAAARMLRNLGFRVTVIESPLDPKYYSLQEIKHILGGISGLKIIKDIEVPRELQTLSWCSHRGVSRVKDVRYHS